MSEESLKEIAYSTFIIEKNNMIALLIVFWKDSNSLTQNQRQSRASSSWLKIETIVVTIILLIPFFKH